MKKEICIDERCKECKKNLIYFKELQKKHKNYTNMKNYTFIEGILLMPNYNSCGHLTHFHIERASKKFLQNIIKRIEISEKESKKIMELKREIRRRRIKRGK